MRKYKSAIISGFPGVGKTYFTQNNKNYKVSDSDSSNFSWLPNGERNPNFIKDYMGHIKQQLPKNDIVFVSSHEDVRDALILDKKKFTMVYPDRSLKEEYIDRYVKRGDNPKFIHMISKYWDDFIDSIERTCLSLYVDKAKLVGRNRYFQKNDSIFLREKMYVFK